jgi:hypothetical protein
MVVRPASLARCPRAIGLWAAVRRRARSRWTLGTDISPEPECQLGIRTGSPWDVPVAPGFFVLASTGRRMEFSGFRVKWLC